MGRWLGKMLTKGGPAPPVGFFVATTGSPAGDGSFGNPWDLQTAMYGGPGGNVTTPAATVTPGSTVWLRGGTYTGQFVCNVIGSAGNYITYRGYPGERATINGNFDNSITGTHSATVQLHPNGQYQIIRDIEIYNTQVDRLCSPWADQGAALGGKDGDARNEGINLLAYNCKLVNCVIHDNGIAIFASATARKWELNGCLSYYNGYFAPFPEQNEAVSVDLVPAAGIAVATSGTYHKQETGATSITIASHINAGDYTLVCAGKNGLGYALMSATFDGAAMTLLVGRDGYSKSVAMFGLKGHTTTANVVINSGDSNVVRGIAQSFVNVNQNANENLNAVNGIFTVADGAINASSHTLTSATGGFTADMVGASVDIPGAGSAFATLSTSIASFTNTNSVEIQSWDTVYHSVTGQTITVYGGTWWNEQWATFRDGAQAGTVLGANKTQYEIGSVLTTNTNHMVVDGVNLYCAYSKNVAPSGDNTGNLIGGATHTTFNNNPQCRMSTATRTGSGTVNMSWIWDMRVDGHGHNSYDQSGGHALVATVATDNTVTGPTGSWTSEDVGGQITIEGAGVAGARYTTTIASLNSSSSIEVTVAPSTSLGSTTAAWSFGSIIKNTIFLQAANYATQIYGSSDASGAGIEASKNLWAQSSLILGGLSGFRLTDTYVHDNYTVGIATNIGYDVGNMTNFRLENNYMTDAPGLGIAAGAYGNMTISGNTFRGATGSLAADFPSNTYLSSDPATNVVTVIPNDYEANRANIIAYNWQGLTTISVDISSAVAVGTPINVMDGQNYYGTPVWTGTYGGGSITLPQAGTLSDLTAAAAIGGAGGNPDGTFTPQGTMAPAFAVFVVRAKSEETWR